MKNILRFFYSMKTAIAELIILCIICAIASIIPQNQNDAYYSMMYSKNVAKFVEAIGFTHAFTSPIFILAIALLCLNLFLCNVTRLPIIIRQYKNGFLPQMKTKTDVVAEIDAAKIDEVLKHLSMKTTTLQDGRVYAFRGKIGIFGAWICHVGFLVVAAGFVMSSFFSKEYFVYGVSGTEHKIGDTGISVQIDDFDVFLREDFTVEQFESKLTVKKDGTEIKGTTQVNHPLKVFGYKFYQNSSGWANDAEIARDGQIIETKTVHIGESFDLPDMNIRIFLHQFYPDFNQMTRQSRSPLLINPHTQFSIFYEGRLMDTNYIEIGQPITVGNTTATLKNPREYSLIQARHDPSPPVVLIGSLLILASLVLAFYFSFEECLVEIDGEKAKIYAYAKRNDLLLREKILASCHNQHKEN